MLYGWAGNKRRHEKALSPLGGFAIEYVTKDDFEKALRAHQEASNEMKSDQRDEAAAFLRSRGLLPTL